MTRLRIHVNWRVAFEEFKKLHGKEPILTGGVWIFEDGATYAKNPRGPGLLPPTDHAEQERARLKYWRLRKAIVDKEAEYLDGLVRSLHAIYRELPDAARNPGFLQVSVTKTDEHGKKVGVERVPLEVRDYERKLERRQAESLHCLSMISEIEHGKPLEA